MSKPRQDLAGPPPLATAAVEGEDVYMPIPTFSITCGNCGRDVGAEVVWSTLHTSQQSLQQLANQGGAFGPNEALLMVCPVCHDACVRSRNGGLVNPPALPSRDIANLPPEVAIAWKEARKAFAGGAFTASEMMSRKILMHLAVDKTSILAGESFSDYVDALEKAGYITTGLKPVVDQVRKRGNAANHELPASSNAEALMTLTIAEHLLEAMYELPGLVPSPPTTTP